MRNKPPFDKYRLYVDAVQDPAETAKQLEKYYRELTGRTPRLLREDFCATFANACGWVKRRPEYEAVGVDLDSEPIVWGIEHHASMLTPAQQKRLTIIKADVRKKGLPKADIIAALNFSFFIFKQRKDLLTYFKRCRSSLRKDGILVLDCFGGTETWEPNEENTKNPDFTYYWEQASFDPITHESQFHIHFKPKGGKKVKKVFSYDWRMWMIPELTDLLAEAGFSRSHVYWEEEDKDGEGTGRFFRAKTAENCPAWVAVIVGEK